MLMPNSTKPTVLSVRGLSKSYSDSIHALRDIDIDVKEGEFLVILGPSGAGKSTLMRCINRLVEPTEGKIFHDGAGDHREAGQACARCGANSAWCSSSSIW